MRPVEAVIPPAVQDPTWERLEDRLGWYDRKSRNAQRRYKWLKLLELVVAAALPVVAAQQSLMANQQSMLWMTGGLAAVIVVLEGAQHLYQFQEHWITYRSTAGHSNTSATSTWPTPGHTMPRTDIANWPSGSRGYLPGARQMGRQPARGASLSENR